MKTSICFKTKTLWSRLRQDLLSREQAFSCSVKQLRTCSQSPSKWNRSKVLSFKKSVIDRSCIVKIKPSNSITTLGQYVMYSYIITCLQHIATMHCLVFSMNKRVKTTRVHSLLIKENGVATVQCPVLSINLDSLGQFFNIYLNCILQHKISQLISSAL